MKTKLAIMLIISIILMRYETVFSLPVSSGTPQGYQLDAYTQHPKPYGGQGQNISSMGFNPMTEVMLHANVTYNFWPVIYKDVTFLILFPEKSARIILLNKTNDKGIAYAKFRIPPHNITSSIKVIGTWNVTVYMDVFGALVIDRLTFNVPCTNLNGDEKVDMKDMVIVAKAFGSYPSHPRWNIIADLNCDNVVSMKDIVLVSSDLWKF
jgi:hypothetical protein